MKVAVEFIGYARQLSGHNLPTTTSAVRQPLYQRLLQLREQNLLPYFIQQNFKDIDNLEIHHGY